MKPRSRLLERALARVQLQRLLLLGAKALLLLVKLWHIFLVYLRLTGRTH